jgi:4'-phosphopantetheinyl transferase EntD
LTLISHVLMPGCFSAEVEDAGQDVPIRSLEVSCVETAAPKRQRDFALGRFCAHEALAQMGLDEPAISIGENGAPVWPTGIVGSITHTDGYAAALVGSKEKFQAIGIDAERIGGVTEALMPRLFGTVERDWLMLLDAQKRGAALTIFFSAKESFYKAFGAQTASRLSFKDIHIEMQGDCFTARHASRIAQGRLVIQDDLVVTAVIVP